VIIAPDHDVRTATDVEALFAEARRRRRRRRAAGAVAALAVAGVVAGVTIGGWHHPAPPVRHAGVRAAGPAGTAASQPAALPAVRVAWLDSSGQLNIGDLATKASHAGPVTNSSLSQPLVPAAGHLYWSDASGRLAPIHDYDIATGRTMDLARGRAVFASADGRHLYIVVGASTVIELRGDGSGRPTALHVPAGWQASTDLAVQPAGPVAGGGILVYSRLGPSYRQSFTTKDGIWDPATGRVRLIGTGQMIMSYYTPPGAHYSLLTAIASRTWKRPDTQAVEIINTSTLNAVMVRSPLGHGFVTSGIPAFSPDGRQVVLFARREELGSGGKSVLAIATTKTGAVRLVRAASLDTTEDAYWSIWLPGARRLLAGAEAAGPAVDTRGDAVRPFSFFSGASGFSAAVVLPGRVRLARAGP